MAEAINMSFRVDKNLKKQADILFKKLGLNTSVALNMFLTQCVREQKIPFTPGLTEKETSLKSENTITFESKSDDSYLDIL